MWGKELFDAPPVQHRFGRQRHPPEGEAVQQAQAKMRAMHDVKVAIDDVRFVVEGVVIIESEELIPDGNVLGSDAVGMFASRSKAQRNSLSKTEPGKL